MSEVIQYKCPACGGAMEFDSNAQMMKCPYCDTVMDVETFNATQSASATTTAADLSSQEHYWEDTEAEHIHVYTCESCGGEILADDSTGATSCPFCGNQVVMKHQFTGDLRPDYIIPFKLDKKAAKEAYFNHIKKKTFVPSVFKDQNHIDEIKGVYVPFWLYDLEINSSVNYGATDVRTWITGDTKYIETSYFQGVIGGTLNFEGIAEDASTKMDDALMESLEPFNFAQAVPFNPAYLAGYLADRYDVTLNDRMKRAEERATASSESCFLAQVSGHHSVTPEGSDSVTTNASYLYALYPVWILNTTWKDEHFIFAMNGQTGKMVGNLPADMKKFWMYILTRGSALTAIAALIFNFWIL